MVRQWQEFFYERRYAATPLFSPDFVKLAEAYGLAGACGVDPRRTSLPAVAGSARAPGHVVLDFRVEQEDTVYPMVPAGADLHDDDPAARARSSKPRRTRNETPYLRRAPSRTSRAC